MLYNVFTLALLGIFLERYIHAVKFLVLWFVSGSVGTLISTIFSVPPWNLGTGASQAVLGIAAFGSVLFLTGVSLSRWLLVTLCFSLIPAFTLDLLYFGYPKPGHIAGALIGAIAGVIYFKKANKELQCLPAKQDNV